MSPAQPNVKGPFAPHHRRNILHLDYLLLNESLHALVTRGCKDTRYSRFGTGVGLFRRDFHGLLGAYHGVEMMDFCS